MLPKEDLVKFNKDENYHISHPQVLNAIEILKKYLVQGSNLDQAVQILIKCAVLENQKHRITNKINAKEKGQSNTDASNTE